MKQNYDIEFFEKLHQGDLTNTQKNDFSEDLKSNVTLQDEAKSYEAIFNGMEGLKQEEFLIEVSEWESDIASAEIKTKDGSTVQSIVKAESKESSVKPTATIRKMGPLKVFASIAAVLIPLFIIGQFLMQKQFANDHLLGEYYQLPISENFRGGQLEDNASIPDILTALKAADFQKASLLITNAKSNELVSQEKLAIIETHYFIAQKEYNKASDVYNKILPQTEEVLWEYEWLEALILIGTNDTDQHIISALKDVTNDNKNPHQFEAKQLLSEMQSFWRKKKN